MKAFSATTAKTRACPTSVIENPSDWRLQFPTVSTWSHSDLGVPGDIKRPLGVMSGHLSADQECPLCPRKRTSQRLGGSSFFPSMPHVGGEFRRASARIDEFRRASARIDMEEAPMVTEGKPCPGASSGTLRRVVGTDRNRKTGALRALLAHPGGGGLNYAGAAFIALGDDVRAEFLAELDRLTTSWAAFKSSRLTDVKWCQPKLTVQVKHLAGSKALRHATVRALAQ